MGLELAIGLAVSLAVTAAGFFISMKSAQNNDAMGQQGLGDFRPTMAKEGATIPLCYGRTRLPGNLIWYDHIKTVAIREKAGGKGGGGGKSTVTGYRFYVDVWQVIGVGKLSLVKTYIDDKEATIAATDTIYNDGTQNTYPSFAPSNANKIKGCAHIAIEQWYIGDNKNNLPSIHFVVDRVLPSTINHANMANGNNPAAIIYDLLQISGVPSSKIDSTSFNAAADYWNSRGYGLNLIFDQQNDVGSLIEQVLSYVDGVFFVNNLGKYALKAIDPDASVSATISEQDIDGFSLNRKTWAQVPNDFTGTFLDEGQDFSQRVVISQNPAAIDLAKNRKIKQTLDLKCFRDAETASKRITEVMKRTSYPAMEIKFTGTLALSLLTPGDIVRLSYADYGIVSADFRIMEVDQSKSDSNEVQFSAVQMVETLHDDIFVTTGETEFESPANEPIALTKVRIFELPYNSFTKFDPAFLILASRENLSETSYLAMVSQTIGGDYEIVDEFSTFSQAGTLAQAYNSTTSTIDDEIGIVFTPYKLDPIFDSISRGLLFTANRLAVIGDEVVAFQNVEPVGGGQYKLTGVIRGVFNTTKATHSIGATIYLSFFGNNVLKNVLYESFYVKIVPAFLGDVFPVEDVTPISVTKTYKAKQPRNPGYLRATRSGSSVAIQIYPNTPGVNGANDQTETIPSTDKPFAFGGDFEISYNSTTEVITKDSHTISVVGSFDLTVKSRINGFKSSGLTLTVGASDGLYKKCN